MRHPDRHNLVRVAPAGKVQAIAKGSQLAPIIVDCVRMLVQKEGRVVGELPTAAHLNTMLQSDTFLSQFRLIDEVTRTPVYLKDFSVSRPGYTDGGPGDRVLYLGESPPIAEGSEMLDRFLAGIPFATRADRTNYVAAGLTVALRRLWPGEKPLVLITSTRSRFSSTPLIDCMCGRVPRANIRFDTRDWAMQRQLQRQLQSESGIGVIAFDIAQLDIAGGRGQAMRSACLESLLTNREVTLASPGESPQLRNHFVVTLTADESRLSCDLLNRSLPIHLAPTTEAADRPSPIGNLMPQYLSDFGIHVEAEFRGMIEHWKRAGSPLATVCHPLLNWAQCIGGILQVNGHVDFLANFGDRGPDADPVHDALAILGAARPGKALRPSEWAKLALENGLHKALISSNERDSEKGRERAIGVVLARHLGLRLHAETDPKSYEFQLNGGFRRWAPGRNPHTRYVFDVVSERDRTVDAENS